MVQQRVTAQGGWGRRPKGDAPDPRPPRWGLAGYCNLDPSHPAGVECANHVIGVPESWWPLPRGLFRAYFRAQLQALPATSFVSDRGFFVCFNAPFLGFA
jgi:hypothetical protein